MTRISKITKPEATKGAPEFTFVEQRFLNVAELDGEIEWLHSKGSNDRQIADEITKGFRRYVSRRVKKLGLRPDR